ncbi:NAD-binding protein [Neobacillus drentensis]|uniref:NAD-binding protein n=1 Tax=Neobacillus drentensis TaxID=220684 RepID=UPI003B586EA0
MKVTNVEMADQLLPGEDKDVVGILHKQHESDGVVIYPSTRLKDLNKDQKKAIFENDKGLHEVQSLGCTRELFLNISTDFS